jgi:hypothetical protein
MYKIVCVKEFCINKDIIYYMIEASSPTICGGCKVDLTPELMKQEKYDEVFDYDPLKIINPGGSE